MQSQALSKRMPRTLMAFFFLAALPAPARDKTDVIILKNGDHVTGEIKSLSEGMLSLKTDSMGTVQIKWEDVVRIKSGYQFRIEDINGRLYYGALEPAPEARSIQVVGPGSTDRVEHLSVVRISEFDEGIWDRFSGSLGLGFSFTKANTTTQLNTTGDILYRSSNWEAAADYSAVLSRFEGVNQADRRTASLGAQRLLGRKWFTFSKVAFEHNSELDLDRRTSALGGIGRYLIQTNRASLRLGGGMIYSREVYSSEPGRNNAEGAITTSVRIFRLYSPKVDVLTDFLFIPSMSDPGRIRMELNSGLKFELFFRDFFWNMSFYESFDSRPPADNPVKNDYGVVTGINWTFRK